jgi:hypothetical protein
MSQPPKKPPMKPGEIVNIVCVVALAYAHAITPFIRTREGKNAYASAPFTFIGLLVLSDGIPELRFLITPWCVLVAFKRLFPVRHQHTHFQGFPWLGLLFVRRLLTALVVEICLVCLAGAAFYPFSPNLGGFVISTSIAMFVVLMAQAITMQADRDRMHDARIEMEQAARMHNGRDVW